MPKFLSFDIKSFFTAQVSKEKVLCLESDFIIGNNLLYVDILAHIKFYVFSVKLLLNKLVVSSLEGFYAF